MRSGVVVVVVAVVLASVVPSAALSPYPYELQKKLVHTIADNPFVSVGEVYEDDEGGYRIDVTCSTVDAGQGIAFILNKGYDFGDVGIIVTVLDEQGNPIEVDESSLSGDPVEETEQLIQKALQFNRLLVSLPGGGFTADIFVEVSAEAIQFFNDDLTDYYGNSNFLSVDVFSEVCKSTFFDGTVVVDYSGAPNVPRGGHIDGFVPAAAHTQGRFDSTWTTDLWIYREQATTLQLWYNEEGGDSTAAPSATVNLDEDVVHLTDVVATIFSAQGHGSISYLADAPVRVVSRTSTEDDGGGTYGQVIPGVSASDAAAPIIGNDGTVKVLASQREGYRANLGLVNTTADQVTIQVDILTGDGSAAPGESSFTVDLTPWGMTQVNDVLARLDPGQLEGLVINARVISGVGKIIAYLSEVDNSSNDPSYQEAFQF